MAGRVLSRADVETAELRNANVWRTGRWQRLRATVRKQEKQCRLCGAKSEVVDHIQRVMLRPDLAFERSNLRALCKRCHDTITGAIRSTVAPKDKLGYPTSGPFNR